MDRYAKVTEAIPTVKLTAARIENIFMVTSVTKTSEYSEQ